MNIAEVYPWLKALHVAAALIFVGGVLAVLIFLTAASIENDPATASIVRALRRWDRVITTPAMLAVWGLGITLAVTGHWFGDGWLQLKLIAVIVLSGVHGIQSGRLRRLEGLESHRPVRSGLIVFACILAISILAVVKP